jgi:hypothetical protein
MWNGADIRDSTCRLDELGIVAFLHHLVDRKDAPDLAGGRIHKVLAAPRLHQAPLGVDRRWLDERVVCGIHALRLDGLQA